MHAVHAQERGEEIYHLDIAYLCRPVIDQDPALKQTLPELRFTDEVHGAAWVALSRLHSLPLAKNVLEVLDLARALETSRN